MPSLLSRIRHLGSSTQPSTRSAPPQPVPASLDPISNLEVPVDPSPSPLVGLQIRPDLNSLLESYGEEDTSPKHQNKDSPVTVPPLPIQDGYSPLPLKPRVPRNFLTKSPDFPTTPVPVGQPTFPFFAEAPPLGDTFGRQQFPLGPVGSGSSYHKAPTRSRSFDDAAGADQTQTGVRRSGWNLTPTNKLPLSGTFERSASVRSLPDRKRRTDRRRGVNTRSFSSSRTSRSSSRAAPRRNQTPPSVVHRSRSESPRTFGYPTPPYSTHTFGHHESPPPPLPPLDHPELALDTRGSRSVIFGGLHEPPNSATAIPHVDNIFGVHQEPASGPSVSRKPVARKQSKTFSVDSRRSSRRSSAEWSAVQATEGVLTNSNSWQAQVSREIFRLSFGEPAATPTAAGAPGNSRNVSHVSATRHPPAILVSPRPPPSLGSPLFLQGQPRILYAAYVMELNTFLLFSDSNSPSSSSEFCGGDQAAVTDDEHDKHRRMTEQGTPALQVANGPSDTKGKQPLKSSLRASSTQRYSAISTVLATPTRQENPPSDSGVTKGKRKADEVDPIPPDQRSLHATFALPEDLPCGSTFSFLQVVTLT